jgi:ABC-type sugar transport system substrate-binding protein
MNTNNTSYRPLALASAAVITVLALSACSAGAGSSGSAGLTIGHSYQNLDNQFFSDELAAEKSLGKSQGATIIDTQASDNPATQLDNVNTLIARGVDVLAIDAVDPQAIVPALDAAKAANIPVISLIAKPASGEYRSLVYLDSVKDGFNACTALGKALNGKGKVINLTGPLQILAAKERAQGCAQALKKFPGITVVAEVNTDYTLRDAEQKMTDTLQAKGEVDGVFGGNDDVALGAIRAMVSAGQDPTKKVVIGVDGTAAALQAICKGQMYQTMATFPKAEAEIVLKTAKDIKAGKDVPKNVLFPAEPVNRENLTDMAKKAGVPLSGCVS